MNSFRQRPRKRILRFQSFELLRPEIAWNSFGVSQRSLNKIHLPTLPLANRLR